ncbi:MAG TPA: hypothetical protein DIW24_03295 [Bacteroidetes bacterium]|nr:hypothetical protein [Bacteroidota bacterium]HRR09416.1 ATP-binding protein [Rhodothermales bacterium]
MIHKWLFLVSKWVLGIFLTYALVLSTLVQMYPQKSRKLGDMYLERPKNGPEKVVIGRKIDEDIKNIISLTEEEARVVGQLIRYELPDTKTFLNIDPSGNIILGIYVPYLIIMCLLVLYAYDRRKSKAELQLRLILLHELEERFRIRGSNLHDVVINPMKRFAEELPHTLMKHITRVIPDEDEALEVAVQLHEPLKGLSERVNLMAGLAHDIYRDIAPPIHLIGLKNTIQAYLGEVQKHHSTLTIETELEATPYLEGNLGIQLFRMVQEAIGNALLHGKASKIQVELLEHGGYAFLTVQDNGCGFDVPSDFNALVRSKHTGLANMKYRAEGIGARLLVTSRPNEGTRIEIRLPAPRNTEKWLS